MAESNANFGTIIGADANFKGEISFDSAAKVLGRFEGSINAKGSVHIADGSSCKATINAKEISVEGHVEGNVEATDRVEVKPTGRISGDIIAARMTMADGASLDGHIRIGSNGSANGKATSAAEVKPSASSSSSSSKATAASRK